MRHAFKLFGPTDQRVDLATLGLGDELRGVGLERIFRHIVFLAIDASAGLFTADQAVFPYAMTEV